MSVITRNERLEFKVGVPVEAVDGPIGHLRQVVLNPGDGQVTALVVRRKGLPARDYVVPVDAVEEASDDVIELKLTRDGLEAQPLFQPERYIAPTARVSGYLPSQALFSLLGGQEHKRGSLQEASEGRPGTGDSAAVIRAGQKVVATDGQVGKVDRVLVDSATRRATHFTVKKGLLFHKDIMVPVEWIAEYRPDVIKLGVDKAELEHLPRYQPDQELQWAVEDKLWSDHPLVDAVLQYYSIGVSARDGVVTIWGHVRSTEQKQYVERMAASVPGVLGVNNLLWADDELEKAVAKALAANPRTHGLPIRVYSWFGYVHLEGEVPTREARTAAAEIAASVPGVENVVNMLAVTGVPSPWEQERLRELSVGQPVYADGEAIGYVEKVLIDPESRRVTGIVMRRSNQSTPASLRPQAAEAVVVPEEHIERITISSVFLSLSKGDVDKLPRFDPADYLSPDSDWQAPVGLRREDVALDLSGGQGSGIKGQYLLTTLDP
jgi:osmotically-inducible protein OsmY/sporulation protein YlmC with PRC-barrel domain